MVRRGCVLSLVLWLMLGAAYLVFFTRYFEWPGNLIAAGIGSIFGAVMLSALSHISWSWRDRRAFARAARREPPEGGQLTIVDGPIRLLGAPLTSPFSGQPCVAYEYEIVERRQSGRHQTEHQPIVGFAMAACAIDTPTGSVRLLGFPLLDKFPGSDLRDGGTRTRAESYVASTPFEEMRGVRKLRLFAAMDDALADADGIVRKDLRLTSRPISLERGTPRERVVRVGEHLCAAGLYDADQRALRARGTTLIRLWPGDLAAARRKVMSTMWSEVTKALLFFVVSHAFLVFAWYMSQRATAPDRQDAVEPVEVEAPRR